MKNRILCVGVDSALLEIRRQVLVLHGYGAEVALASDVKQIPPGRFDLVIVSAMVGDEDKLRFVRETPQDTGLLILEGVVVPAELLALIKGALTGTPGA